MAEGKDPVLKELEQSLINFLTTRQDIEEKVNGGARRVKGLTFNINVKNPKNPSFTVQIGMCEASFNVQNGQKIQGSCFGCERYVRDWFERPTVSTAIEKYVKDAKNNA